MSDNGFWMLTNEQRRCFGIAPVEEAWERVALPRSKYDEYDTAIYLDGDRVRYIVRHGERHHIEHALDETLTPDHAFIVPKRSAKPIKLSAATICKRSQVGMSLCYYRFHMDDHGSVNVHNAASMYDYSAFQAGERIGLIDDLPRWVADWCAATTEADIADAAAFAARKNQKVKLPEGVMYLMYASFQNCTGLTDVYLPSTLKVAGDAFSGCTKLQNIYFAEGNPALYDREGVAFQSMYGPLTLYKYPAGRPDAA